MRKALPILIAASTAASSCLIQTAPEGRPPAEIDGAFSLAIADASPIRREKETPVLTPPEVFAVYVPSHVDRENDLLVGEHWVYFKLSESEWFSEKRIEATPKIAGEATEAQLAPLKALAFDKAVTPWKESKP